VSARGPASAIPDALEGLLDVLLATPELGDVAILDGPPVSPIAGPGTVLIVGGNGDEDDVLSATAELSDASMGRGDTSEQLDLRCHLEHWQGGDDVRACRRAAFDVLTLVKAAVGRDPRLGGAVTRARLTGSLSYAVAHFEGDTGVGVPFIIRCNVL
jgi:hypothetical protein